MLLEKMTSQFVCLRPKSGIGQFCIHFMRIITLWLCAKLGIALLPDGCRPIPLGHYNFDPAMAREFGGRDGYTKAIIYQYIANWVIYNQEHGKNYADGRFWSYNSGRAWAEMIKLWDTNTVEKHIKFLRDAGALDAKAMKAHKGDQTLWFTIPRKESNGGTQISLPLDSNAPMVGEKAGNDSSISLATNPQSTVSKHSNNSRAHTAGGGVAQFPERDRDPKEGGEPKTEVPEARTIVASEDGSREDQAPPPVAPAPSPIPAWMPNFFTGCSDTEIMQILHSAGGDESIVLRAKLYAEYPAHHIDNPAGFVRAQLAKGWRPPVECQPPKYLSTDDQFRAADDDWLRWVVSDESNMLPLNKKLAQEILDERHKVAVQ